MISLKPNINYIVSGLERSGTSMLMQILEAGGIPVMYDKKSRREDKHNPRGYYELEGGKVIDKLMKSEFQLDDYLGKFIKVTSYGILFLPGKRKYTILYIERDMDEILNSTDKMIGGKKTDYQPTLKSLERLNHKVKREIFDRVGTTCLLLGYNNIINDPRGNMEMILEFLDLPENNIDGMIEVVDKNLYRNRGVK